MAGSFALPRNKVTTIREGGKTFNIYGATDDANPFYLRQWLKGNQDLPDGEYDVGPDRPTDGSVPVGAINTSNGMLLKGQQVGATGKDEVSSQRIWRRPAVQQQPSGSTASEPEKPVNTRPYDEARARAEEFMNNSQAFQSFEPKPLFSVGGPAGGPGGGGGEFDIYNQLFARGEELGAQYGRFIRQSQLNNDEAMQAAALGISSAAKGLPRDLALSSPLDLDTSVNYVKRFRSLVNP